MGSFLHLQFAKDGSLVEAAELDALLAVSAPDLFLLCHGWNNGFDDALGQYRDLSALLAEQMQHRTIAIAGVLWPSKRFEFHGPGPRRAAALSSTILASETLREFCELFDPAVQPRLAQIRHALRGWNDDPGLRTAFIEMLRELLPAHAADAEDGSDLFLKLKPEALLRNLSKPEHSIAAGFQDYGSGWNYALSRLLNYTTYYVMKLRSGDIGVHGLAPVLRQLYACRPGVRLHLVGHSFGCRALSAAVNALPAGGELRPHTMTLLQAAFSHHGFALKFDGRHDGAFRSVVEQKKVRGPILITHTRNDRAVGLAYPIAARMAGQIASTLGGPDDLYGALGSNGAQTAASTPERVTGTLGNVGCDYPFTAGDVSSRPFNLRADRFISGHSDILKPEVAYAIATASAGN